MDPGGLHNIPSLPSNTVGVCAALTSPEDLAEGTSTVSREFRLGTCWVLVHIECDMGTKAVKCHLCGSHAPSAPAVRCSWLFICGIAGGSGYIQVSRMRPVFMSMYTSRSSGWA